MIHSEKLGVTFESSCLLAHLSLMICDPMDYNPLGSLFYGLLKHDYWSGLPLLSPWDFPDPGLNPWLLHGQAGSLPLSHMGSPVFNMPGKYLIHINARSLSLDDQSFGDRFRGHQTSALCPFDDSGQATRTLGASIPKFDSLVLPDNLLEGEARLSSWPLKDATALLSPDAALE